jgi:DNA (cytosine-5)-methyltransferase 1
LKSKITHAEFYCNGKLMDSYLDSLSGTTFAHSMANLGQEKSMSSQVDSLVRTFQPQEKEQDLKEKDRDSGEKWRGSFVKYDPDTSLWRTHQCSLLGDLELFSENWPQWGLMRDGECWEQQTLAQTIRGTESGLSPNGVDSFHTPNTTGLDGGSNSRKALRKREEMWPTPVHSEARQGLQIRREGKKGTQTSLSTAVLTWPTPRTKGMCGGSGSWDLLNKNTTIEEARLMGAGNGGQLNPTWVEWLMGWPLGWTDLKPLVMDKSHCVPQQLGES